MAGRFPVDARWGVLFCPGCGGLQKRAAARHCPLAAVRCSVEARWGALLCPGCLALKKRTGACCCALQKCAGARPPPRQPGHNSAATHASADRAATATRGQQHGGVRFLRARTSSARARAQQRGGARFCMALRQQLEHSSTGACASTKRYDSQSAAAARRRALLQSAAAIRAQQARLACRCIFLN